MQACQGIPAGMPDGSPGLRSEATTPGVGGKEAESTPAGVAPVASLQDAFHLCRLFPGVSPGSALRAPPGSTPGYPLCMPAGMPPVRCLFILHSPHAIPTIFAEEPLFFDRKFN